MADAKPEEARVAATYLRILKLCTVTDYRKMCSLCYGNFLQNAKEQHGSRKQIFFSFMFDGNM